MRNNKKGFTIVELVIVIAVIAILAAVLIPTFSNVIDQARQAKDTQLVRNLNTSLALDVGKKHNTMQDALDAVAQQGYDLDKINASAMQAEILWDSHNDVFVYLTGEGKIEYLPEVVKDRDATNLELWQICQSMPADQKYSIYAGSKWNTATIDGLKVGFDAGTKTNITSIKYTGSANGQTAVIRTNGGALTIDAENDIVNHYNEVQTLAVQAVDLEHSYHEFGKVGYATIAKGHFVAEAKSEIKAIVNEGAKDSVKIDKDSSATVVKAFTTDNSAKLTEHGGNVSLDYLEDTDTSTVAEQLKEIKHDAEAEFLAAIMVNGVYYLDIKDAFDRVANNSGNGYVIEGDTTVTLFKDVEDNGIVVLSSSNLIFDFNGHTYYVKGTVGSSSTTTNGFQLLSDANVTFKNGTLTCTETSPAKLLIQNYANLTLDNMILDGANLKEYKGTLSTNNGNVVIKDTTIIAKENSFAFDVCSFSSYKGANVTVKGNSVIQGKIELSIYTNKDTYQTNVTNWALKLETGDFSACTISVYTNFIYSGAECTEEQKTDFYNNVITKTQKGNNVNIAPPTGYTWVNNQLAKAD